MENKKKNPVASIILTLICILWMYPIVLILVNSLKKEAAITTSGVFSLPTAETWNGVANFVASVTQMDFLKSFWYSLVISVMSVALIMLCCSMAAWYIVRVNGALSKVFYYLCVFSMVVPFQMVMFLTSEQSIQHLYYLSWIWCRSGSLYVYRICKGYSACNRRSGSDRWLYTSAGILQGSDPDPETNNYRYRDPGTDVGME